MKKSKKLLVIILLAVMLLPVTGCTKYLQDSDGKNIQNKESFHVVKTDEEFTQPQWLTDYLAGNN